MEDWKLAEKLLLRKKHVEYYKYGKEIYYTVDGKKEGEYKSWHENGKLCQHCFYKDGKREGEYKLWHDNGQLYLHCLYKDDKKER